jgi:uncharacterized protein involved in exopolysaccharide biosynthesis
MNESDQGAQSEIKLIEWYEKGLDRWPWVLGLALLGALIGLGITWVRPPIYEAEAVLGISINYGITEPLELVVEDRTLGRASMLIRSDDVIEDVLISLPKELSEERGWVAPSDLNMILRLDRRLGDWGLVAKDEDPNVAAEIARLWAEISVNHLDEAMQHAWRAAVLLGSEFDVECAQISDEGPDSENWECQVTPLEFDPSALEGKLQREVELSRGILPVISYELLKAPTIPSEPAVWGRGVLVLGGGFAGMLLGLGLTLFVPRARE